MQEQNTPPQPVPETPAVVVNTPQPTQNKFSPVIIGMGALLLISLLVIGFLIIQMSQLRSEMESLRTANAETEAQNDVPTEPAPTEAPDPTADWETFQSDEWGFSFKYPAETFTSCNSENENGVNLWEVPFTCPSGHDTFYLIGITAMELSEYSEYKEPVSENEKNVGGIEAVEKTYSYDSTDGPLIGVGSSVEIVVPVENGVVVIQLLSEDVGDKNLFDQILSTFEFTE